MTQAQQLANLSQAFTAGGLMFRNLLINPCGRINQRGYASGAATSGANQYTLDRWRVVTSGQNLTVAITNNIITFTAPAGGMEQVIEGANIEGGSYCLAWTGTATATVNGAAVANGGTFTLPANTNATVRFSGGTVYQPQLELGTRPTPFERRQFGMELALCQRYYVLYGAGLFVGAGECQSTTLAYCMLTLPVPMRAQPTITASGTVAFYTNAGSPAVNSFGTIYGGANSPILSIGLNLSGLVAGQAGMLFTSSATMSLSAEL